MSTIRPTVVVIVMGGDELPEPVASGLANVIRGYFAGEVNVALQTHAPPVTYGEFRRFCQGQPGRRSQTSGRANRAWLQFLERVPEVPARCMGCGTLRGVCRCEDRGFARTSGGWVYLPSLHANWTLDRPALLSLTAEQWARLNKQNAEVFQAFADSLRG